MKKKIALIIVIGFAALLSAQQYRPPQSQFIPEHDFRFGVGVKTFEAANLNFTFFDLDLFQSPIDFTTKDFYSGARYTTNSWFLEYIYQANSWFGVGLVANYLAYYNNYLDGVTNENVGNNYTQHFSIYPTIRFTWLRRNNFNMYSSFGIGQRIVTNHDYLRDINSTKTYNSIAGQITLVGFTLGNKIYGFSDLLTLGSQGELNVGIGYRLSIPQKKNNHEK